MEISQFLQRKETAELRHSFLRNVGEKNKSILQALYQLREGQVTDRVDAITQVFLEVHRLKGSGGTYGFNEVSINYKETLLHVRPPHENKREPTEGEVAGAIQVLEAFDQYVPCLYHLFDKLLEVGRTAQVVTLPVIGVVNQDRRDTITHIEKFCMSSGYGLVSMLNSEEGLFGLGQIVPQVLVVDQHLPDSPSLAFIEKIKHQPALKEVPVFILSRQPTDKDKEESLQAGAAGYIRDTDVGPALFQDLSRYLEPLCS